VLQTRHISKRKGGFDFLADIFSHGCPFSINTATSSSSQIHERVFVDKTVYGSIILGLSATILVFWASLTCHFFRWDEGDEGEAWFGPWRLSFENSPCMRANAGLVYYDVPWRYGRIMTVIVTVIGFLVLAVMLATLYFRVRLMCRKGFNAIFFMLFCLTCSIMVIQKSENLCEWEEENHCKWGPGAYMTILAACFYLGAWWMTLDIIISDETENQSPVAPRGVDVQRNEPVAERGISIKVRTIWVPFFLGLVATAIVLWASMNCRFFLIYDDYGYEVPSFFVGPWRTGATFEDEHACATYGSEGDYRHIMDADFDAPWKYARAATLIVVTGGFLVLSVMASSRLHSSWDLPFAYAFFVLSILTASILALQGSRMLCIDERHNDERNECRWGPGAFMTIVAAFFFLGASWTSRIMRISSPSNENGGDANSPPRGDQVGPSAVTTSSPTTPGDEDV
jgi:hypothetical protein